MEKITRRDFLCTTGMGATALMVVPNTVLGKRYGHVAPCDKLNIAGIGVGGAGKRNLQSMGTENIVALCDADWTYSAKTFVEYPKEKRFKDVSPTCRRVGMGRSHRRGDRGALLDQSTHLAAETHEAHRDTTRAQGFGLGNLYRTGTDETIPPILHPLELSMRRTGTIRCPT